MFCSRCGSEITGKSKFCPSCGLDLMATTPVHAIATGALQEMDLVREALASEYEIIEELGRGGMAMVYRARDRHLEREVAIKGMLMKDPAERYQSCEELVASIQGQPIAAAGSVRASVATVAAGASTGAGAISPVMGGAPLI